MFILKVYTKSGKRQRVSYQLLALWVSEGMKWLVREHKETIKRR